MTSIRRGVRTLAIMLAAAGSLTSPPAMADAQDADSADRGANRPNFIFILLDDLDTKGLYQLIQMGKMPNLVQHIMGNGMIFPESFVTNSVCCPSRASLLSGQYNHNNGVLSNGIENGGVTRFNDTSTIGTWLRDAGYYTGYIGKYLNGYGVLGDFGDPLTNPRNESYVPPGWDDWNGLIDPYTYWMYDYKINDNGVVTTYGDTEADYQTDVISGIAQQFVAEARALPGAAPFFLMVNPAVPHDEVCPGIPDTTDPACRALLMQTYELTVRPAPRHADDPEIYALPLPQPPSLNEADISDKPTWLTDDSPLLSQDDIDGLTGKYRDHLASMLAVDEMIGALAAALGSDYGRTAFIFTSDNGYLYGEHRQVGKEYVYEEAIRVPLIMRLPNPRAGPASPRMVTNIDWAPTILQMAGATVSGGHILDGRSFAPLYVFNPFLQFRKRFLVEHWPPRLNSAIPAEYSAVRTDWLADPTTPNQTFTVYTYPPELGGAIEREHYDMQTDAFQETNIYDEAAGPTTDQQVLEDYAVQLSTCAGQTCRDLENQ